MLVGFGTVLGDLLISDVDDVSIGPFELPLPISIFGRKETLLYVSKTRLCVVSTWN